jgi:multidrug efflux pump subunit AcrB
MIVNVENYRDLNKSITQVQNFCDRTFVNADIIVRKVPIGPPYDAPVEIRIMGYEIPEIMQIKTQIVSILRSVKHVTLVEDDWGDKIPNLSIDLNHFELARLASSPRELAVALEGYIDGIRVDNFRRKKNNISLIFALNQNYPLQISDIDTFEFYAPKALDKEVAIYKVYAENKAWPGNLNLLIDNLNFDFDNRLLYDVENFAERRISCD